MSGKVTLRAVAGPMSGREFEFDGHAIVVAGRSADCGIQLPDDDTTASRHHFLVEINPPAAVLKDLGSRFGTVVDGVKVGSRGGRRSGGVVLEEELVSLGDGSRVTAGATVFEVEVAFESACVACGETIHRPGLCEGCVETQSPTDVRLGRGKPVFVCALCGKPATADLGSGRRGTFVCRACSKSVDHDPLGIEEVHERQGVPQTEEIRSKVPGHQVISKLGSGGMGAVYLARRVRDGMWVALKVLLARVAVDDTARRRFERESSIIEQLNHPNIVQFFDRGSDGPLFYFTMDLCAGGSAADLMRRRGGSLSLGEAGPIVLQVLEALDYAHRKDLVVELADGQKKRLRGVVHRDVKPDNILLTGSEKRRVSKLSDFGLAKSFEAAGLSGCTVSGQLGGALLYMPPEQVRGFRHLTPVSDLWSVGATLYDMLTGTDPRGLADREDPFQAILDGEFIPLRERNPEVPDHVAATVERALSHDLEDRYPDAATMRFALLQCLYGSDPSWASDVPGSTPGTLLEPAAEGACGDDVALLHVSVGRHAGSNAGPELLHRLHELHTALRAQPAARVLTALKCTGDGFLALCADAGAALAIVRGVLLECDTPQTPVRAAVHWGPAQAGDAGDLAGVEIEWLLSVQEVEDQMLVDVEASAATIPSRYRLLVTRVVLEQLPDALRSGLVRLGRFKLPRFGRPEEIWLEHLDAIEP